MAGEIQISNYRVEVDKGCVFASRCPFKMEICEKQEPIYVKIGKSMVKCWLYAEK